MSEKSKKISEICTFICQSAGLIILFLVRGHPQENHQENPQVQEQEMINQLNLLNYNDEEQVNHFLKIL